MATATTRSPVTGSTTTRRDRKLTLAGYAVLRVSELELKRDPERVMADLRALLSRRAP